jgi:hypothetical protein
MKAWILAGLATVVMAPSAFAAESTEACQVDDARRATQERAEAPPAIPPSVTAAVRPTAQRDVAEAPARAEPRRRTGKRIPDAELIGPRSTL